MCCDNRHITKPKVAHQMICTFFIQNCTLLTAAGHRFVKRSKLVQTETPSSDTGYILQQYRPPPRPHPATAPIGLSLTPGTASHHTARALGRPKRACRTLEREAWDKACERALQAGHAQWLTQTPGTPTCPQPWRILHCWYVSTHSLPIAADHMPHVRTFCLEPST